MSTPAQPATPTSGVADVLGKSFNLYFARFGQYILIPVMIVLPAYIINAIVSTISMRATLAGLSQGNLAALGAAAGGSVLAALITGIIQWGAYGLVFGLVAKVVEAHLRGQSLSIGRAFEAVKSSLGGLVLVSALFGLATALGMILLVIPGLAALFFFCVTPQAVVFDRENAFSAFGRAAKVVLKVPAEVAVVLVLAFVYTLVTGLISGALGVAALFTVGGLFVIGIISGIFAVFLVPWVGIALSLAYLRAKELGA